MGERVIFTNCYFQHGQGWPITSLYNSARKHQEMLLLEWQHRWSFGSKGNVTRAGQQKHSYRAKQAAKLPEASFWRAQTVPGGLSATAATALWHKQRAARYTGHTLALCNYLQLCSHPYRTSAFRATIPTVPAKTETSNDIWGFLTTDSKAYYY